MLNVYRPVPRDLFAATPPVRSRRALRFFMSWYDAIAGAPVIAIMALLIAPAVTRTPLLALWLLAYLLYLGAMLTVARAPALRQTLRRYASAFLRWLGWLIYGPTSRADAATPISPDLDDTRGLTLIQIALALALTAAALLFVVTLDQAYRAAGLPATADVASWLLFVLPMLRVARYASMLWIAILGALVILSDIAAAALVSPGGADLATTLRTVALHACWLTLLSLLPAITLRSLSERRVGLTNAIAVVRAITALQPTSEGEFASEAAAIIAQRMGYDEVNVLIATSADERTGLGLRFLGAATSAGRALASEGYIIEQTRGVTGITGWAAVNGQERLVNDVQRDPARLYYPHPSFPRTCAELAIPLTLGGAVIGVLDVQSEQAYVFGEDDVELLRAIAAHLALSLDNVQRLTRARGLATVTQRIARRLLSHQDLRAALEQVVNAAYETLRADSVALYPCERDEGGQRVIGEPVVAGDFRSAPASAARVEARGDLSAVARALDEGQPRFARYDTSDDAPDSASTDAHDGDFIIREGIRAAAILPLRVGDGAASEATIYGVIFVNYASSQVFSEEFREWCMTLADLAALALQSAMLYQRIVEEERANTWTELHDGMVGNVSYGRMLLEQVLQTWRSEGALKPIDGEKLHTAHQFVLALQRQVRYLMAVCAQPDPRALWRDGVAADVVESVSLFQSLREHAALVQRTLEMRCIVRSDGDDAPFGGIVLHDARMVVREAMYNAYRHGRATEALVEATADAGRGVLLLRICDNGCGFDTRSISTRAHGLSNIRNRAARHHGDCAIESSTEPGRSGTTIEVSFHLTPSKSVERLSTPDQAKDDVNGAQPGDLQGAPLSESAVGRA